VTLSYFWAQHNEHRVPFYKLILLSLGRMTEGDFRAGMWLNFALLSGMALFASLRVEKIRGQTFVTDAIFALLLLHLGHTRTFTFTGMLHPVGCTVLNFAILFLIGSIRPEGISPRRALALVILIACLTGWGANSLPVVPLLGVWLAYAGWQQWRQNRTSSVILLAGAMTAWALCGLYLAGWQRNPGHPVSPGWRQSLGSFVQVLSLGSGHFNTPHRLLYAGFVALAVLAAVYFVCRSIRRHPAERLRATGLLATLAAITTMALAIGHARTWYAETGSFGLHYVLVMSPLLGAAYLIFALYSPPRFAALLQASLFALLAVATWQNYTPGEKSGKELRSYLRAIEVDIHAGLPPERVALKCRPIHPSPQIVTEGLRMLQEAGMGPYKTHAHSNSGRRNPKQIEISKSD
jgi:hypothetical protein